MRKWEDIEAEIFTPEQIARSRAWVANEAMKINLAKIRKLAGVTQAQMAKKLKVEQASVSRAESATDPKLSTVRRHVEALGGKVVVLAILGDKSVRLDL